MINKTNSESTERLVQGPDRVYRWTYTLPKEQALVHFKLMNTICAIIATAVSAIMIFIFALGGGGLNSFGFLLLYILFIYVGILGMPAAIGYLALGSDTRSYEMDDTCIRHKGATRGGDAVVSFDKVKWASERGNAIILKEGITTYTMYAPLEDAAFVKEYVRARVGSEKWGCRECVKESL